FVGGIDEKHGAEAEGGLAPLQRLLRLVQALAHLPQPVLGQRRGGGDVLLDRGGFGGLVHAASSEGNQRKKTRRPGLRWDDGVVQPWCGTPVWLNHDVVIQGRSSKMLPLPARILFARPWRIRQLFVQRLAV